MPLVLKPGNIMIKLFFTLFEWSLSDSQEHLEPTMIGSTTFEVV